MNFISAKTPFKEQSLKGVFLLQINEKNTTCPILIVIDFNLCYNLYVIRYGVVICQKIIKKKKYL